MSKAADMLRGWADDPETANDTIRLHLRAVADLMEAGRERVLVQGSYRGSEEADMVDAVKCLICGCIGYCAHGCALAALERVVTGESDAK